MNEATRQAVIDKAAAWAVGIAEGAAHGYDQTNRWGPDYDCSSFVISAWQQAGVPVKTEGASYTGNMYFAFIKCGFEDVTNKVNIYTGGGMKKGDVLLNKASHTEMYIGDGKCVRASINEDGRTTGGRPGDQSGREIYIGRYYNYPWEVVLRYAGGEEAVQPEEPGETAEVCTTDDLPVLRRGMMHNLSVLAMQGALIARGFGCGDDGADGDFGGNTEKAVKAFQEHCRIEADGICGPVTWGYLLGVRS